MVKSTLAEDLSSVPNTSLELQVQGANVLRSHWALVFMYIKVNKVKNINTKEKMWPEIVNTWSLEPRNFKAGLCRIKPQRTGKREGRREGERGERERGREGGAVKSKNFLVLQEALRK